MQQFYYDFFINGLYMFRTFTCPSSGVLIYRLFYCRMWCYAIGVEREKMRKNHSKIVCIKLVHLPYLYIYDAQSHLHQMCTDIAIVYTFCSHMQCTWQDVSSESLVWTASIGMICSLLFHQCQGICDKNFMFNSFVSVSLLWMSFIL